jgi:hypothetical protein
VDDPANEDLSAPVPNKLHLRGLDVFTTAQIRTYVADHHGSAPRVEWIDDTSANLVFPSDDTAREALAALAAVPMGDASQLAPGETVQAKPFAAKPEANLQLRMAVLGDRKEKGAAERSRFYLLHPEHDPEERRRRGGGGGGRRRNDDRRRGDRRSPPRRDRERRHDEDEIERFPDSFYDEPNEPRPRRGHSRERSRGYSRDYSRDRRSRDDRSRDPSRDRSHGNAAKELFPGGASSSRSLRDRVGSRNRSLSPGRRRNYSHRSRSCSRSRSPASAARQDSRSRNKMLGRAIKDRLADKTRQSEKRDLFSSRKLAGFDSRNRLDQLESAFGSARLETDDAVVMHPDDIAPETLGRRQRGLNIHGAARGDVDQSGRSDFSIRGSAGTRAPAPPRAKELFPGRLGGGGGGGESDRREAEQRYGRAGGRQRASDLFG